MAYRFLSSLLPILLVSSMVLAMAGESVAARNIHAGSTIGDKKQPQWWVGYDGVSVLIPGIGRVTLPPKNKKGFGGHTGSYDTGSNPGSSRGYIPGGDDTFVPNPGFEVPSPAPYP